MQTKCEMRRYYAALRKNISDGERKEANSKILSHILTWDMYQKAKSVMCFVSYQSEVDTLELITNALSQGKEVYVPYCYANSDDMCACRIFALSDLQQGKHGILAPKFPENTKAAENFDMIFVPGLAFDKRGYRLGYGRGYYDKFLQNIAAKTKIVGLAFFRQICEKLPAELHDKRLDVLICERGITRF